MTSNLHLLKKEQKHNKKARINPTKVCYTFSSVFTCAYPLAAPKRNLSRTTSYTSPTTTPASAQIDSFLSSVCNSSCITLCCGRTHLLSINELVTTLTELNAIIAPAIIGCKWMPNGKKMPMASGIPRTLYTHAHAKLRLMVLKIVRERSRAATTSRRSERIRTISAASIATEVPDESAIPTVAAASAGESLIPSPT